MKQQQLITSYVLTFLFLFSTNFLHGQISGNFSVCEGETETYTISASGIDYDWSATGGTVVSGNGTNTVDITWSSFTAPASIDVDVTDASFNITPYGQGVVINAKPNTFITTSFTSQCTFILEDSVDRVTELSYDLQNRVFCGMRKFHR